MRDITPNLKLSLAQRKVAAKRQMERMPQGPSMQSAPPMAPMGTPPMGAQMDPMQQMGMPMDPMQQQQPMQRSYLDGPPMETMQPPIDNLHSDMPQNPIAPSIENETEGGRA